MLIKLLDFYAVFMKNISSQRYSVAFFRKWGPNTEKQPFSQTRVRNPNFCENRKICASILNYGEFAIVRKKLAGKNSLRLSVFILEAAA